MAGVTIVEKVCYPAVKLRVLPNCYIGKNRRHKIGTITAVRSTSDGDGSSFRI